MYVFGVELRSFASIPLSDRLDVLRCFLEGVARANVAWLRLNPTTPPLYESGVLYEKQPIGADTWRDIPEALADGKVGDCKILAAWRVAELRGKGEPAHFFLRRFLIQTPGQPDQIDYHVQVERADRTVEDPSALLGMNRNPARIIRRT